MKPEKKSIRDEHHCEISYLTIIAGRDLKEDLTQMLTDAGVRLIDIVYGKSSVRLGYLREILGFVPQEQKVILTCLMKHEKEDLIYKKLIDEFDFNKPNTGIAFSIPVEKLSF